MTKVEQVSYLAGLVSLLDSFDDAGAKRPEWLAAEYTRTYNALKETVQKEQGNETRKRDNDDVGAKARTDLPRG